MPGPADELVFDTILVRKSESGFNPVSIEGFVGLPVDVRIRMIREGHVRFLSGETIVATYDALRSLQTWRKQAAGA